MPLSLQETEQCDRYLQSYPASSGNTAVDIEDGNLGTDC